MSHCYPKAPIALAAALILGASLFSQGCATREVYVIDRDPGTSPPPATDTAQAIPTVDDVSSVQEFHEPLQPYGTWHVHRRYGRVFSPGAHAISANWRPYTHGHWEYTEWEWTWVSHDPFGWATDHYGRWSYDAGLGWIWVPGVVWGPAWVTWRDGGGYIGWAPLPPGAYLGGSYGVHDSAWVFVHTGHF